MTHVCVNDQRPAGGAPGEPANQLPFRLVAPRSLVEYHDFYRGRGVAQGRLRRSAEARLLRGCPPRPVGRDEFHGSLPPSGQWVTRELPIAKQARKWAFHPDTGERGI